MLQLSIAVITACCSEAQQGGPNEYHFSDLIYYLSRGGTSAVAIVTYSPGGPGRTGHVDFTTLDGTAVAGLDYTPVARSFEFGYYTPGYKVAIPVLPQSPDAPQKTIRLLLKASPLDPSAHYLPVQSILTINVPPPPNLQISVDTPPGTIAISWIQDGTHVMLEKLETPPGTNWVVVSELSHAFGAATVHDVSTNTSAFYRLRRSQ